MGKHAYLIIAHKDDYTFRTLLNLLDDVRNDIFVHMDLKNIKYESYKINDLLKHSVLTHTSKRISVNWGGYSQIEAEMLLLELAIKTGVYDYYHLISGEDLPIKSQNFIHNFFDTHSQYEFVRFENKEFVYQDRVMLYHPFQEKIGRSQSHTILSKADNMLLRIQKTLHVQRNAEIAFQKGTNWFSITDELAKFIVDKKEWVQRTFCNTQCADEVFLQTIVHNSKFAKKLYHSEYDNDLQAIMRLIDWKRGNPYIFRNSDRNELRESEMLFARKFDCQVDKEIIDYVATSLTVD